jgi:hypothetical protein
VLVGLRLAHGARARARLREAAHVSAATPTLNAQRSTPLPRFPSPHHNQLQKQTNSKSWDELSPEDRMVVGGALGGETRKAQLAAEHGGSAHEAYAEMGKKGGEARKEQISEMKEGDVGAGYAELAQKGEVTPAGEEEKKASE